MTVLFSRLRSRELKLAQLLNKIGTSDSRYVVTLNEPIAQLLQLNTDEEFLAYDRAMDEYVKKTADDYCFPDKEIQMFARRFGMHSDTRKG